MKSDTFPHPPGDPSVYMPYECVCAYWPAGILSTSCSVPGVRAAQCISCRFWVSTRCPIQLCTGVPARSTWHYNGHDQQTLLYLQQPVTAWQPTSAVWHSWWVACSLTLGGNINRSAVSCNEYVTACCIRKQKIGLWFFRRIILYTTDTDFNLQHAVKCVQLTE